MNATEIVYFLKIGEIFKLRGRLWKISDYRGGTIGNGYVQILVWNDREEEVLLKVRESDKVERILS